MTATDVNGVKVVRIEEMRSANGHTPLRRSVILHLEDGTHILGCTAEGCNYTGKSPQNVSMHNKTIHDGWSYPKGLSKPVPKEFGAKGWAEVPLGQVTAALQDRDEAIGILELRMGRLLAERDGLRDRVATLTREVREWEKAAAGIARFANLAPKKE